jgi:hypothetical protein
MPGISSDKTEIDFEPKATVSHINNCAFSSWYSQYRNLCPKTRIIKPLPAGFVEYLLADGITLPPDEGLDWDGRDKENEDVNESEPDDPTENFSELHNQIIHVIAELGGSVTPKLNWSAPKDATWISTNNSLKCVSPSDIYLLLKASSYITHDLSVSFEDCSDAENIPKSPEFELVVRKWFDINPALEFRCFIRDRHIVGITQRDMNFYDFLVPLKDKLLDEIEGFFEDNLKFSFTDPNFVIDLYIPRPYDRVWLIDINPYSTKTDTLLFSWEQLGRMEFLKDDFEPDFRLVEKIDSSRGFGTVEHSENAVPKDFVEAGVDSNAMAEMIEQMRSTLRRQETEESSNPQQ